MADKRIYQLDAASTLSAGDKLAIDKSSLSEAMSIDASLILQPIADVAGDVSTLSGEVSTLSGTVSTLSGTVSNLSSAVSNKAAKSDLTSISTTGSTNNSGSTITSGTFFYKSGSLARALTDIASGATLTLNTNYELVTAGGLNELNSALSYYIELGEVSDVLTVTSPIANKVYHFTFKSSAANNPSDGGGHGFFYSYPTSGSYGQLVLFISGGNHIFQRGFNSGAYASKWGELDGETFESTISLTSGIFNTVSVNIVKRSSKIIYINFRGELKSGTTFPKVIGTISSRYIPSETVYQSVQFGAQPSCLVYIDTNGNVTLSNSATLSANTYINFSLSYILN